MKTREHLRLPKLWRDGCKRKAAYALADASGRLRERAGTPSGTGRAERLDLAIEVAKLHAEIWIALSGDDDLDDARDALRGDGAEPTARSL